ncbi:hypothetical protein SBA5_140075 [Candidatus Sulfotelmatomonas gaucii]|uniref:Uncharacterized protein n=1 Tax=Candidatus Sulfuritelmatomonas gaucii TaxID=2043161 RepID=A0A2N9L4J4_9BACT|nr:hypothetical protein SBA5_140075 [Candidatus Sulfotelmatomonas gaucii]
MGAMVILRATVNDPSYARTPGLTTAIFPWDCQRILAQSNEGKAKFARIFCLRCGFQGT